MKHGFLRRGWWLAALARHGCSFAKGLEKVVNQRALPTGLSQSAGLGQCLIVAVWPGVMVGLHCEMVEENESLAEDERS